MAIPDEMDPWGLSLDLATPTVFGQFALVGCEPADIEGHHQVQVIDENGLPLGGVGVLFGWDNGPDAPRRKASYWLDAPRVARGNYQRTNLAGYCQHTFGQGGETIYVRDLDRIGALKLSSDIVYNCRWIVNRFNHTGIKLTFQRRQDGFVPLSQRLIDIERRLGELEAWQRG